MTGLHTTALDNFFWVAGFLGDVTLLAVLIAKHRARQFPLFTTFIAYGIYQTIALFSIHRYGSEDAYYYAYWTLAVVDVSLELAVFYEAASKVFSPGGRWDPGIRRPFLWMISLSVTIAVALAWLSQPATKTLFGTIIMRGNFSTSVLISLLFVGMVVLSVTTGLPWRTHIARIVQGLGVEAVVGILIEALQSYFGSTKGHAYQFFSHIQIGTHVAIQVFWIAALAIEAPEPRTLPAPLYRHLLHLNQQADLALAYLRPRRRAS